MGITLICPNLSCSRTIVVPDWTRGKVVRCAHCSQPFLVPGRSDSVSPPPPVEEPVGAAKKDKPAR
jgi:hypothetical protein